MGGDEIRVLPGGRVLLAETNYGRVTERDKAGNIVHNFNGIQPLSAEPMPNGNWLVIGRSTIWEVKLRPDVTWHDGKPFTADDVIYTFGELYLSPIGLSFVGKPWTEGTLIRLASAFEHATAHRRPPSLP